MQSDIRPGEPYSPDQFFRDTRSKPFYRVIKRVLTGDPFSDTALAKMLSSYVTHALIEIDRHGDTAFPSLMIPETSGILFGFVSGELDSSDVIDYVKETFSKFFTSEDT